MKKNEAFWPSYVDIMTTLFAIMLILFAVSFGRYKFKEQELLEFKDRYNEIKSIYNVVENIDTTYFEFDKQYVKHIFRLKAKYKIGAFSLENGLADSAGANKLKAQFLEAGREIKRTIETLQQDTTIKLDCKYLVVIEGQSSSDGYYNDDWHNNDVLSYQRALALHHFWQKGGIDFSSMPKCELVISGSGEHGVPRDRNEVANQRFLIHIVPVIGNIRLNDDKD